MAELVESTHAGEFILWEADPSYCRENVTVTVPASTTLPAGSVLALDAGAYVPLTEALVNADAALGILYGPLTNDDDAEAADLAGVIVNCIAAVRGGDLDWNDMAAAVQDDAIALLLTQGIKVRDYTPLGS